MRRHSSWWRTVAVAGTVPVALGASFASGPIRAVTTHAAAGATQTVQHPTYLGTTSLSSGAGSGQFVDSVDDATAGGAGSATRAAGPGNDPSLPNPSGLPVSGGDTSSGFNGLDHFDQRTAGTGAYTNTQFSLEPPDQGLCVGNGFVLESVNTAFEVYDTHGNPLLPAPRTNPATGAVGLGMAFSQFFGLTPEIDRVHHVFGDFVSDPKCAYDPATQRWFMTLLQANAPGNLPPCAPASCSRAHTLVAVSTTADPRGSWNLFSIEATDDGNAGTPNNSNSQVTCPCFGDQPLIGMNADALFISTNEYGTPTQASANPNNPENGAQIYAVSKSALEQATAGNLPPVVHVNAGALPMPSGDCCPPFDSIQPATSPTAASQSSGFEYFLSSFTNSTAVSHSINTWVATGTDTLSSAHPGLDLQRVELGSEAYTDDLPITSPGLGGIAVDQKDGPHPLGESLRPRQKLGQVNANDVRMNQVVYAAGRLWSGVNTALRGGPARSGIAYFVVQPGMRGGQLSAAMANQGYVSITGNSTLFPSVGVDADGNGAIAFSVVGNTQYPSAAYVRIGSDGQLNGGIVISGAGAAPDDGFTQYPPETGLPGTVGRWGDYSAAVAGPDGSIWMAAEYIPPTSTQHPRTVLANWGTFVTHIAAEG